MKESPWIIREAKELDIPFIYATWLNSYRGDSKIGGDCAKSIYANNYTRIIDRILSQSTIQIAALPKDEYVILGYSVHDHEALHYVFVKEGWSKMGIAKSLIRPHLLDLKFYTHRTGAIGRALELKTELVYNPFLLFNQGAPDGEPKSSRSPSTQSPPEDLL